MTIAAAPGRRKAMALALAALAGCAAPPPPLPCATAPEGPLAWVVDHGWHTDIALRTADLAGPLAGFRTLFPGAGTVVFGFGKRSFMLAGAGAVEELLLGPLPGPGVVQVKGLRVAPPEAYPEGAIALPLPEGGLARLSAFLWESLALDAAGRPVPAHPRPLHDSLFYESSRGYSLLYTCNTWTAEALRSAGLPVHAGGVVLTRAVLGQLPAIPGACAARRGEAG
ncbi:DUF2459 domain-containing protein [Roseicella aerolata]|uniref:DUF2459 domain-containing protein n=1 Tax=Roseicella aerolata TaxID=2883479 RepID=A0A9X1LBH7_9PROT|nr:DUF2459 domain-containing protein [Roseicella aerolata]MCB4823178.1 DUF2459 domain-containing protein [Roseicella aerolata]